MQAHRACGVGGVVNHGVEAARAVEPGLDPRQRRHQRQHLPACLHLADCSARATAVSPCSERLALLHAAGSRHTLWVWQALQAGGGQGMGVVQRREQPEAASWKLRGQGRAAAAQLHKKVRGAPAMAGAPDCSSATAAGASAEDASATAPASASSSAAASCCSSILLCTILMPAAHNAAAHQWQDCALPAATATVRVSVMPGMCRHHISSALRMLNNLQPVHVRL